MKKILTKVVWWTDGLSTDGYGNIKDWIVEWLSEIANDGCIVDWTDDAIESLIESDIIRSGISSQHAWSKVVSSNQKWRSIQSNNGIDRWS